MKKDKLYVNHLVFLLFKIVCSSFRFRDLVMSDKVNEKRSLLVNLSKNSSGYDTNSIVTTISSQSPHLTLPIGASQYSKMQKKRTAPRPQLEDDEESKCI